MLFVKTVLVNVLRNFEVSTNLRYQELELEFSISLKVAQKCMINVKKRATLRDK